MKVQTITYHKVFSLGNYENEKIGVEIEVHEGDDVQKAIQQARDFVEFNHKLNGMHNDLQQCEYVINNPDEFTVNQVKQAREKRDRINDQIERGSQLLIG